MGLDKANKDKHCKHYPATFQVQLFVHPFDGDELDGHHHHEEDDMDEEHDDYEHDLSDDDHDDEEDSGVGMRTRTHHLGGVVVKTSKSGGSPRRGVNISN